MPTFDKKQIEEINSVIEKITNALKENCEIAACDAKIFSARVLALKIDKTVKYFPCKREYSDTIIAYFKKEKGLPVSRFSTHLQSSICLLY